MTFFSTAQYIARGPRKPRRSHMLPIMLGCAFTVSAIALVAYLLWPTWGAGASSDPARLPVSIGATLFNVPTTAIRMKIQRHSGPQERVDLSFAFPSLEPPDAPKHVSADSVEETMQPMHVSLWLRPQQWQEKQTTRVLPRLGEEERRSP